MQPPTATKYLRSDPVSGLFAEHLIDALLRGDTTSRYTAYDLAIGSGWMTRNEVRVLENLNPMAGLDEFVAPVAKAAPAAGQIIVGSE